MSSLEETFVSKASALQRQGRAGRVRDGFCFRMYTRDRYCTLVLVNHTDTIVFVLRKTEASLKFIFIMQTRKSSVKLQVS